MGSLSTDSTDSSPSLSSRCQSSPRPDALTTRERVSHASQPLLRWKKTEAKYSSAIYFLSIPVPVSNPIKFLPQRICQRSQSLVRRSTQAQHFYDLKKVKREKSWIEPLLTE